MPNLAADFYHKDSGDILSYNAMASAGYSTIGLKVSDGAAGNWGTFVQAESARVVQVGMDLIAYHWLQPNEQTDDQVSNFLAQVQQCAKLPDYLAVDFEWTYDSNGNDIWATLPPATMAGKLINFANGVYSQFASLYPGPSAPSGTPGPVSTPPIPTAAVPLVVYAAPGFWNPFWAAIDHDTRIAVITALNGGSLAQGVFTVDPTKCRLWMADYSGGTTCPAPFDPFAAVWLWQYTESGTIPGFAAQGGGDISVFE